MSPTLNRSSAIRHFEGSDEIKIRDGITFDFYMGLPHMYSHIITFSWFLQSGKTEQQHRESKLPYLGQPFPRNPSSMLWWPQLQNRFQRSAVHKMTRSRNEWFLLYKLTTHTKQNGYFKILPEIVINLQGEPWGPRRGGLSGAAPEVCCLSSLCPKARDRFGRR